MPDARTPTTARRPLTIFALALVATLAACGGGGEEPSSDRTATSDTRVQPLAVRPVTGSGSTTIHTLELGTTIAGFPHKVDVYWPAGATRAIVFLHGNGGTTGALAYTLGFSRSGNPSTRSVKWDWLSQNGVIAVLPQGQAAPGSTLRTWSNYIFKSGQDDVAFLRALADTVRTKYGVSEVSLAGYSSGGMMSARVWCEATEAYKAFVSVAGPMMSGTALGLTCTPQVPAPYFVLLGAKDPVLPAYNPGMPAPTPEQSAAGLTAGFLVAEWTRHADRSGSVCGESTLLSGGAPGATGTTWNNCDARMRYTVLTNADHTITSIEAASGAKLVDTVAGFVD